MGGKGGRCRFLRAPDHVAEHPPRFLKLAALYAGESLDDPEFREFTSLSPETRSFLAYQRRSRERSGVRPPH